MWAAGKGSDDVIRTMLALTPQIDINMADKYGGTGEHRRNMRMTITIQLLKWTNLSPIYHQISIYVHMWDLSRQPSDLQPT